MLRFMRVGLLVIVCCSAANAQRPPDQHLGPAALSDPTGISREELHELVSIVFQEGMTVDFELLCAAMEIKSHTSDCKFRQVSVWLKTEQNDILSFNVPNNGERGVSFAIVFHAAKDLGEIFVVSMDAELRRVYVRQANGRFQKADEWEYQDSFKADMAYWSRNLGRVYDDLGLRRPKHRL